MTTGHPPGCDCCTGLADKTPLELDNRPGLPQIAYRAGTYGHFRASMLAGLTRASRPALAGLKTRDPSDFSVGLIDAWAVAADVLTFYTERIANEHYLGTATERRSIGDMVALIGYQLKPGVAAQAWLAFTLETAPGSPPASAIPLGAKVQTLPGPNEDSADVRDGRAAGGRGGVEPTQRYECWNRIRRALASSRYVSPVSGSIFVVAISSSSSPTTGPPPIRRIVGSGFV